jgi:hypothetical protein
MKYPDFYEEEEPKEPDWDEEYDEYVRQKEITEKRSRHISIINQRRKANSEGLLSIFLLMDRGCYLDEVDAYDRELFDDGTDLKIPRADDTDYFKNEINVYRAVHIGKLFGLSPNKRIFSKLKKPKGHKFKYKLQELIKIIEQDKSRYEKRLQHAQSYF